MPNVYVEPRPKGSGPIEEYVVEDHAAHALHTPFKTQQAAVEWAEQQGHDPLTARVRTTDKGNPDHWRSA
jgi:hypothetical protein